MKLLVLLTFLASCAQQEIVLSGKSNPYTSKKIVKVADSTHSIEVTEVIDERARSSVGEARTGVQYSKTPIRLITSPSEFVNTKLTSLLKNRNVILEADGPIKMTVYIHKLWITEVLKNNESAKCELNLSFNAFKGGAVWKGNIDTKYQSAGDLGDGTDKLDPTLATCFNNLVTKLASDREFIKFIKK